MYDSGIGVAGWLGPGDLLWSPQFFRHIPQAIRDALTVRDPECVVPGCGSRLGLQIDHIHDFAHNGPTSLDNLCRLCRHHHRLKTIGRYTISRNPDGTWNYRPQR